MMDSDTIKMTATAPGMLLSEPFIQSKTMNCQDTLRRRQMGREVGRLI